MNQQVAVRSDQFPMQFVRVRDTHNADWGLFSDLSPFLTCPGSHVYSLSPDCWVGEGASYSAAHPSMFAAGQFDHAHVVNRVKGVADFAARDVQVLEIPAGLYVGCGCGEDKLEFGNDKFLVIWFIVERLLVLRQTWESHGFQHCGDDFVLGHCSLPVGVVAFQSSSLLQSGQNCPNPLYRRDKPLSVLWGKTNDYP
jgi:hypothetical protein